MEHLICIRLEATTPEAAETIARQVAHELTDRKGLQGLVKQVGPYELGHFYVLSGDLSYLLKAGLGARRIA
jgi:hypothetical protein